MKCSPLGKENLREKKKRVSSSNGRATFKWKCEQSQVWNNFEGCKCKNVEFKFGDADANKLYFFFFFKKVQDKDYFFCKSKMFRVKSN